MTCPVISNFSEDRVVWGLTGAFVGLAKDGNAVESSFREDGGEMILNANGDGGTIHVDNDYSGIVTVRFDEASETYALLRKIYEQKKGALADMTYFKNTGEIEFYECTWIKSIDGLAGGFRANNPRTVTFECKRLTYTKGAAA